MAAQTGATNIVQLPLAFVRSGYVALSNGYVVSVGSYGYNWSRTSKSSPYAYLLNFYTSYVNPSSSSSRFGGRPLRCLYQAKS